MPVSKHTTSDGSEITRYTNDKGQLHRFDGPAWIKTPGLLNPDGLGTLYAYWINGEFIYKVQQHETKISPSYGDGCIKRYTYVKISKAVGTVDFCQDRQYDNESLLNVRSSAMLNGVGHVSSAIMRQDGNFKTSSYQKSKAGIRRLGTFILDRVSKDIPKKLFEHIRNNLEHYNLGTDVPSNVWVFENPEPKHISVAPHHYQDQIKNGTLKLGYAHWSLDDSTDTLPYPVRKTVVLSESGRVTIDTGRNNLVYLDPEDPELVFKERGIDYTEEMRELLRVTPRGARRGPEFDIQWGMISGNK